MERLLELLRHENGVLVRREHMTVARQIDYGVRTGTLRAVLPGVYTAFEPTWQARIHAAAAFRPGCVFTGACAALMLWWPEVPINAVSAAVRHDVSGRHGGFCWERRVIPPDLVVDRGGLRMTCPALSILDLIPVLGGTAIDEGLRRGAVSMAELHATLRQLPNRASNGLRRRLLDDSRDEPWSEAERSAHRLLRAAGIAGWRTNFRITIDGVGYWVDIAFPDEGVVVEIDGWSFHNSRRSFEQDRWRYGRLAAAGWRVLPFPASAVDDHPEEFVELIRVAIGRRSGRASRRF